MFLKTAIVLTSLGLVVANPLGYGGGPTNPPKPPAYPPQPPAYPPQPPAYPPQPPVYPPPAPPAPAPVPDPAPAPAPVTVDQCNTGSLQCCSTVSSSSDPSTSSFLGGLGVILQGLDIPIGLNCDSLSIIGLGPESCTQSPLCCDQAVYASPSLIGIDCSPLIL